MRSRTTSSTPSTPDAVQRHPAVDHDVLAGDEAGEVGAEEHDDVGDVVGRADPGERRLGRSCAPRGRARAPRAAGAVSGVAIIPGDTALTRIVGAYSSAAVAVSAATAAFAAAYGASPADGPRARDRRGRHDRAAARLAG